jgi:DnaK suppressor protein
MPRTARPAAKKASAKKAVAGSSRGGRVVQKTTKKATPKAAKKAMPAGKGVPARAVRKAHKQVPAKKTAKKVVPARKGVTAKRTVPAKKAIRRSGPNAKFLQEQRLLLDSERAAYSRQAEALKAEADQLAEEMEPGDIQFDEESGEGGTMNVERERDLALSAQAQTAIEEIDRALAKIDAGTYGICEQCGQPIPKARLKALPYAALCVACKSGGLSRR